LEEFKTFQSESRKLRLKREEAAGIERQLKTSEEIEQVILF
jgi:hypothetical protein